MCAQQYTAATSSWSSALATHLGFMAFCHVPVEADTVASFSSFHLHLNGLLSGAQVRGVPMKLRLLSRTFRVW